MTKVAVSAPVLHWAVERSGKPSQIEQKFPKLSEWLKGESQPTLRQLEDLANATATPLGYFFLPEPPVERLSIPHFRTLDSQRPYRPSPNLLETVELSERRQAWMQEYLIEQGQQPLPFVGSARLTDKPARLAQEIRAALGLADGWAADQPNWTAALWELQQRVDRAGLLLVVNGIVGNNTHRKLDVKEFRGFVLVDPYCPLVFINGSDGKAAQMFTLAHELAHVWFGSSAVFDLRELQPASNETEQACNQVAAEFLVPEDELRAVWPRICRDAGRFQLAARHFKVSELVAARRALDLTLITRDEFLDFYREYLNAEHQAAPSQGGNFYATQTFRIGRRLAEAVVRAVREGKLLYREAYQLTGLYGKAFEGYAALLEAGAQA